MKMFCLVMAMICVLPTTIHARARVTVPAKANLSLACIAQAADRYKIPLAALLGILATEGGQPGEALNNTNGTWDLGPFQVNTCHIKELLAVGLQPETILSDACVNAHAAAWLLHKELGRSRTLWEAIGAYHSRTPHFHHAYLGRLQRNLAKLRQGRVAALIDYANGKRKDW